MQNLFRFLRRYYFIFLFLFLEGVSILFMVKTSYYQSSAIVLRGNKIAGNIMKSYSSVTDYFSLKEANRLLAEENAKLHSQIENSYIKYTQNEFIHSDTVYKLQYKYIEAEVIQNSVNKRNNYLMLNKGSDYGIKPDMAVISSTGIVGIVAEVSKHFSIVMSVLHSDSRHSVKLRRTNVTGTLLWEGRDYRKGTFIDVPTTHKLYKNDTVVTSGFSQDFPEGIPVGYVHKISHNSGSGFYTVDIGLATDFNKISHVYVITNLFREEQKSLQEKATNE